jgi:hypothetical protein
MQTGQLLPNGFAVLVRARRRLALQAKRFENPFGAAAALRPKTFLHGSYKHTSAIHTINDVDIVVLCRYLSVENPNAGYGTELWARDRIFDAIAAPLLADGRYRSGGLGTLGGLAAWRNLGLP